MIISTEEEKTFDKIQHPLWWKLSRNWAERTYLNIIKAKYDKPTANFILNGENLKAFSLSSGAKQGCPLSPLLFSTILEVLATAVRVEKLIKGIQKEVKLSIFADDLLYIENTKEATRKILELFNEFSKVAGYKINTQKSFGFLYANNGKSERETKNPICLHIKKNKIPRNKHNQVIKIPVLEKLQTDESNWRWHKQLEKYTAFLHWKNRTVKITILLKAIYRFNVISFKLPVAFFTELKKNLKICMETQKTLNSQSNLEI